MVGEGGWKRGQGGRVGALRAWIERMMRRGSVVTGGRCGKGKAIEGVEWGGG